MISPFKLGQCCTYLMVYLSLSCIKGKVSRSFAFPNLSIYYSLNVINVPNWYPKLNQSFIAFLFYCSMYIHQLSANLISPPWCTAFDTYFNNECLYSAVFKRILTQLDECTAFQFSGWICSFNKLFSKHVLCLSLFLLKLEMGIKYM